MNESQKPPWRVAAERGALVVHPVAGLVAYILGAFFGCKKFMPDGARVAYGWQGGSNGLETLILLYFLTLGILPLVLSAVGAAVGVMVSAVIRNAKSDE